MAQAEYNFEKICRSCLSESNNLKSLLSANAIIAHEYEAKWKIGENTRHTLGIEKYENIENIAINELVMACTHVKIFENDGLPQNICNQCISEVCTAFAYKRKCEVADHTLREYLQLKGDAIKSEASGRSSIKCVSFEEAKELKLIELEPIIVLDPLKQNCMVEINDQSADDIENNQKDDSKSENDEASFEQHHNDVDVEFNIQNARLPNGRYECHICQKSLADPKTLKLHIRLHTGQNLKRCKICDRGFAKQNHLTRHMASHEKKEYPCGQCPEVFENYHDRRLHASTEHRAIKSNQLKGFSKKTKPKQTDVNESTKVAANQNIYNAYPNGHKKCVCRICDAAFDSIIDLRSHLNWHNVDDESFNGIDWKLKKELLFNPMLLANQNCNVDQLKDLIKASLQNDIDMFGLYQITNESGFELSLSDSETENECNTSLVEPKTYTCFGCQKEFSRAHKIMFHMKEHPLETFSNTFKNLDCQQCQQYFPCIELLSKHQRSQCLNKQKQFTCTFCNYHFMWENNYNNHLRKMHSIEKKNVPARRMKIERASGGAEQPREKNFKCNLCPQAFFRQEHLARHRKIHIPSEKKFSCDLCKKRFNRKDNLKSHMRVHQPDTEKDSTDKHLCVYCGRSFSNSSNLIVHMRRHTGEKPYSCDLCDKGFPRSSDLQCHRRTHTGEKPCLCTICGKSFSRSNKLVRHLRIHTGIKPYKCHYCDRAFTQSNDLTLHIRRHTGEKPYVCGICGDRYIQGTALAQHRRMQGHYEDSTQPTPFSNISVNNPSRYTNANRVNRIGTIPVTSAMSTDSINSDINIDELKPVLAISISTNGTITTQSLVDTPIASISGKSAAGSSATVSGNGAGDETTTNAAAFMANGTYVATMTVPGNNQEMPTLFNLTYSHEYN